MIKFEYGKMFVQLAGLKSAYDEFNSEFYGIVDLCSTITQEFETFNVKLENGFEMDIELSFTVCGNDISFYYKYNFTYKHEEIDGNMWDLSDEAYAYSESIMSEMEDRFNEQNLE